MDHQWYFIQAGEPQGPLAVSRIVALVSQGVVGPDTFVWTQGQADWEPLSCCMELAEALEAQEPASKRQRRDSGSDRDSGSGGPPPSPRLAEEVPDWVEQLDETSTQALFERALFHHLADIIAGRPTLRDELLQAYVQRHPEAEERDPACYKFTDAFLLESITDFESREQLWEVLGRDNLAAVRSVITAAARLDRRYCGQLHAVALLGRARQLLREGQGGQLAELLRDGDSLALVRDLEGRSLWHDLAVAQGGRGGPLLRLLLPIAATAAAAGAGAGAATRDSAAAPGGVDGQQQLEEREHQEGQQEPHCLDLSDAAGNTSLHLAAVAAQLEAARLLIDAGASLNLQNRDTSKYAAGDWSLKSKDLDFAIPVPSLHQCVAQCVALLLEHGAARGAVTAQGKTALDIARVNKRVAIAALLEAREQVAA